MITSTKTIGIFHVLSNENEHIVDIQNRTCINCKGWYYGQKRDKKGDKICTHLEHIGYPSKKDEL